MPDYPSALEEVVLKALAKSPEQRFASANDMLSALEDAMPGPLEASFEVEVAEYLKRLFGARATERRAAIRMAQEHADRQRAESSSSISVGTLRAIAVDPRSESSLPAGPPSFTLTSHDGSEPPQPQKSRAKPVFAVAALIALVGLGAGIRQLTSGSSSMGHAAGSSPVPAESLSQAPARSAAPAAPIPAATASAAAETTDVGDAGEESPKSKRDRKMARAQSGPRPAQAPATTPTPATAVTAAPTTTNSPPSAAAPAAAAPAAASTNAWDRGAFGGRH